ncbi:hypothetical protein [Acinetobacter sp. AOR41_HL]|uniref:hypothetical protein n=1 Tax=Acinetobacter sp. AOR41_HL TaxID=2919388 RepID=UPI0022EA3B86|nr:hypothetical protein [Acinetobacter sp. AOR41_HL]MDA3463470.1 hypothetical protein [Acinetobacter sp. AOR41_HL]
MKPEHFIREQGLDKAREVVSTGSDTYVFKPEGKKKYVHLSIADLKRLVESLDIIWKFGSDIKGAKQLLEFVKDCESVSIGQRTIQVERLAQAIRDHESIYGGSHES